MEKKEVIVVGSIGNTERSNRDADRVLHRGGAMYNFDCTYICQPTQSNKAHKEVRVLGHLEVGGERGRVINPRSFMTALSATDYKDPPKTIKHLTKREETEMSLREEKRREEKRREEKRRIRVIAQMDGFESSNRVYDKQGLSPTINTCGGGHLQPKVIRKCLTKER